MTRQQNARGYQLFRLSDGEARSMAEKALRECLPTFIQLMDWRNRSGSFPRETIPYSVREEAERIGMAKIYD